MSVNNKIGAALERIVAAAEKFKPRFIFSLLSGGHDSITASFVTSLYRKSNGAVHINTGIGVEATREYVRETCQERCWNLQEYKAVENTYANGTPNPMIYEDIVMQNGFPGEAQHSTMYSKLKERQLRRLERDLGVTSKSPVMFISGARSEESRRRMGNTSTKPIKEGRRLWVNAIHDFTKADTSDAIKEAGIKRNLVVDLIHMSGECLCGAFARKGQLAELAMWPQTQPCYERITSLQKRVLKAGFPWGWEDRPPKEYMEAKRGQLLMRPMRQHLCWSCYKTSEPCKHKFEVTSPIDTVETCIYCGETRPC